MALLLYATCLPQESLTDDVIGTVVRGLCDKNEAVAKGARTVLQQTGERARPALVHASQSKDEFLAFFASELLKEPPFAEGGSEK